MATSERKDADLSPETLVAAYCQGAFPMADPLSGRVHYYTCDPRAILPLDERFHVPRSLARTVRSARFTIRYDTAFGEVVRACAAPRSSDSMSWISPRIAEAYTQLHELGFAHSVEAWRANRLVGGLYGVAIGGAFFGESMFSRPDDGGRDASKVCLVHLVERLRRRGFVLLDSQYANEHIQQFGAIEIPQDEYLAQLERAINAEVLW